ncbi:hypothetical protein AeRB84_020595 [Aphanomyces euteiches]|nr:hypothetical protein AeRB84_020595 [Aphanomyces euteiches]
MTTTLASLNSRTIGTDPIASFPNKAPTRIVSIYPRYPIATSPSMWIALNFFRATGRDPTMKTFPIASAAISQGESSHTQEENQPNPDIADTSIALDMLPTSSFTDRVTFSDNDVAYTNTDSPIKDIADKRWITGKEIEYLVTHSDGTQHWTPRSRLQEYQSFIQEYEDRQRSSQGLPPFRRSPRFTELDLAPDPPPEY